MTQYNAKEGGFSIRHSCKYPIIDLRATGINFRRLRKDKKIRVSELTEYLGLASARVIYKWQNGECLPSLDNLYALSKYMDLTMEEIIIEEE